MLFAAHPCFPPATRAPGCRISRRATRLVAWMIPGEARVFALAELELELAWVVGDET